MLRCSILTCGYYACFDACYLCFSLSSLGPIFLILIYDGVYMLFGVLVGMRVWYRGEEGRGSRPNPLGPGLLT